MNAPISNSQYHYSLGNLSYVDHGYDEPTVPVVKTRQRGIGQWLSWTVAAFVEWRRRQRTLREMDLLTDRELSDIGLTRSDLPRVFDPAFAADHSRGRNHIAY